MVMMMDNTIATSSRRRRRRERIEEATTTAEQGKSKSKRRKSLRAGAATLLLARALARGQRAMCLGVGVGLSRDARLVCECGATDTIHIRVQNLLLLFVVLKPLLCTLRVCVVSSVLAICCACLALAVVALALAVVALAAKPSDRSGSMDFARTKRVGWSKLQKRNRISRSLFQPIRAARVCTLLAWWVEIHRASDLRFVSIATWLQTALYACFLYAGFAVLSLHPPRASPPRLRPLTWNLYQSVTLSLSHGKVESSSFQPFHPVSCLLFAAAPRHSRSVPHCSFSTRIHRRQQQQQHQTTTNKP